MTQNISVGVSASSSLILWLLGISLVAAIVVAFPPTYMGTTRNIFAWSFDRLLPRKFSDMHERLHTPVYAIGLIAAIQTAGLIAYTYGPPSFLSLLSGAGAAEIISFSIVAIAAIVFPFRRRQMYQNSSAKKTIGKVPLITIVGIISLGFYLLLEYFYISNPLYGANIPAVFVAMAVSLITPLVIFVVSFYNRRNKGINILKAFEEIPPE